METHPKNNIAYIDGANLHKNVFNSGWRLDYHRFRVWLREKYNVGTAYLFVGFIPENKDLYNRLRKYGYNLVFKEVSHDSNGKVKGNCDSDLVLKAVSDFYESKFNQAIVVSSDGDYASLIRFLKDKNSFAVLISPSDKCSFLLEKIGIPIVFLSSERKILSR